MERHGHSGSNAWAPCTTCGEDLAHENHEPPFPCWRCGHEGGFMAAHDCGAVVALIDWPATVATGRFVEVTR